ncbi:hypothetical protein SCP_0502390 [Sparassis crispa]|uniref:Protein BZZ1 n=1 Tax=Sparassis crispa TaxID=139825 RepID=A0A401GLY9_9APHY|nr:hypothetical protein SCP_0502390 [Sparassis crispa]GBE83192.1 hypothetical protein SCP_0502390 [Sparassis crispa]
MSGGQTYGKSLPDQVDRISSLSDAQLELVVDVRELFRERAAIEREYATKLQVLARKATEKKNKKIAALVVGNEPTKACEEDVLLQSTINNAYSQLILSLHESAQDHLDLSDAFNSQVVDALKSTERRHDEAKKKQIQYFQKLLSERDRVYSERLKNKQKYDEECAEVETYRQKQERSTDDRHADRATRQYEQQYTDMLNSKNVYLISTAISNKVKKKFYSEDIPMLQDQFQDLQTQLITKFAKVMLQAQAVQTRNLDELKSHITTTEAVLGAVDPQADQVLFIEHNISSFTLPTDWSFEPCATHYDTGDVSVAPAPKVFLQNRLHRCRAKLQELRPVLDAKRKEMEQFAKLVSTYSAERGLGDVDEVSDNFLDAQHQFAFYATSETILTGEIDTITAAVAGDEGGESPHTFKSSAFSIPTQCAYCKSSIWGLSKQGKTCKSCGISVHSKCELKVPADCSDSRGGRSYSTSDSVSSISRSSSVISGADSLTPSLTAPTPSSFARTSRAPEEALQSARVLFDFSPTSPFELAISGGNFVHVLEEDDGSGWVKVSDNSGGKGLVPASYLELEDGASAPAKMKISVPTSMPQQGSGKYVRGIYAYEAQGPDELDVEEGGLIELTGGPTGGTDYGDGWWEGIDASGKKGIFPSNYVEFVR